MKSITNIILTVSLLFLCASGLSAAEQAAETPRLDAVEPLTPDDLFEIALKHNPDHQKNLQNASLNGSNTRSAWGTIMPSLDVGFSISQSDFRNPTYVESDGTVSSYPRTETIPAPYVFIQDDSLMWLGWNANGDSITVEYGVPDEETRNSRAWVSLQESINLGGQQYFMIRNAGILNRMNDLTVKSSEMTLYQFVRQNYYNVLAYQRLYDLALRVLDQRKEQLRLARARYEVGSVTELDVLQAEIDVGNQENAVIEAENSLKIAQEELNRILGVELESKYQLLDKFEAFEPELDLEELVQMAITSRPDFLYYQENERYSRNNVWIQRGRFLPNLTASLSHTRSENSGSNVAFTTNPRNRNTTMALTLSWNLFNGFSDEAQLQQSRVDLNNARHDRKAQEQLVEQGVRSAYYTLMQTWEQSRVTEKNRQLADRQLALEQERYRLGATSQLNLRTAQVTYEEAETNHISNIFSFWSNLAALEASIGQRLR
jgi:outer membrane protein